jgi:SpoVK/Ycf46/Vps4 family AAA+-type ATPase
LKEVIDFINSDKIESLDLFSQLKCTINEAKILQYMLKQYIIGNESLSVVDVLSEFYDIQKLEHLEKIIKIKNLLELGWIVQSGFTHLKISEITKLELLNSSVSLSASFLKLLEDGTLEFVLPEIAPYLDHLEYLQDQFFKIDLAQKLNIIKVNFNENSPNINRLKSKLILLENRIKERVSATNSPLMLEEFFKEYDLDEKEQMIFLALLKEEYASNDESIRDMNTLLNLISSDDYEKIKHRSLLEEGGKLVSNALVDYDEMINPFGGISRNFYIPDEILYKISNSNKKKTRVQKIKIDTLIKEQSIFELIEPKKGIEEVILNTKTKEVLDSLLKQVDKTVSNRLIEWGIKDKKKGIDARIIFYGAAGTGKTLTALAIAKSLRKKVLSFDCSKILSMYVGESEKNVRNIFDTYRSIVQKSKSEPILLLNEADQFLSTRTEDAKSGSEKMHNQMQNIFLEQIERFDGILIATTNLLESIDKAFSRRFNYKIEFLKPNEEERVKLWELLLPKTLPFSDDFDIHALAKYPLSGGQIELIIKNAAYKIATLENPIFSNEIVIEKIKKEQRGTFDNEKLMGFLT